MKAVLVIEYSKPKGERAMFRLLLAATLLGLVTAGAPAAPPARPKPAVFEGVIADVWGFMGCST